MSATLRAFSARPVVAATITVVVGQADPILARGLTELIADDGRLLVLDVAADRDSLLAAIGRHEPDVVICDAALPPAHADEGVQVLRHLEATRSRSGFLLLSRACTADLAATVLAAGDRGRGCLCANRPIPAEELHAAIRTVAAGSTVIDPALVAGMVEAAGTPDPLAALTRHEREVLALIAEGLSNEGIAERLRITPAAVEKRVTSLFRTLPIADGRDVNRRVAAALLYRAQTGS